MTLSLTSLSPGALGSPGIWLGSQPDVGLKLARKPLGRAVLSLVLEAAVLGSKEGRLLWGPGRAQHSVWALDTPLRVAVYRLWESQLPPAPEPPSLSARGLSTSCTGLWRARHRRGAVQRPSPAGPALPPAGSSFVFKGDVISSYVLQLL